MLNEKIVDVTTGDEITRPYTAEEIAQAELEQELMAAHLAKIAKLEADKATAKAKLVELGLTTNDLKALGL